MNTSKIKSYAIAARRDFLKAVTERANYYGIFSDSNIEPMEFAGDVAIIGDRAIPKKEGNLRERLVERIKKNGFEMTLRKAAYSWFNRFVALRYMELHDYLDHGYRVLSNSTKAETESDVPEILEHAADIDLPGLKKETVIDLRLAGNKDNELYRMLIVAQCNALNKAMPFLFEKIDDETELLLPDNLLHSDSLIRKLVSDSDAADWDDVEIIGWLYQFYISEKKDEVIGKVVKSEDIPAATQLFTPNWIVKYMVQNTLGRMWLATYPGSALRDKMEYYIEPAEQEPDVQKQIDEITPKELNPETITFLDPACGSGHILVEAYDVFKEIYLERGYRTREIPNLVLSKNLFGLDIDDRAAQLAGFAVLMKARADDRRILGRDALEMNIMSIQQSDGADKKNIDIFFKDDPETRDGLNELITLFEHAKTFGSLITVPEDLAEKANQFETAVQARMAGVFGQGNVERLHTLLKQARILGKKYDCVVTNPPYMGNKGMNGLVKGFLKDTFPDVKSDLFSAFILQNTRLAKSRGQLGFMTPFVWMFISSYEKLRDFLINHKTITSLIQLEYSGFDGATVPICTFTLENTQNLNFKGGYIRLSDFRGSTNQGPKTLEAIQNPDCGWFFHAAVADFKKIPGNPIAYWISDEMIDGFGNKLISDYAVSKAGIVTGDDALFLKQWSEISFNKISFTERTHNPNLKIWVPMNKGGSFRKFSGNNDFILNIHDIWSEGKTTNSVRRGEPRYYYKEAITWSMVTSSKTAFRISQNKLFGVAAPAIFLNDSHITNFTLGFLNSKIVTHLLSILNPTLNVLTGDIMNLPLNFNEEQNEKLNENVQKLIENTKSDWDAYETSWDFSILPLHKSDNLQATLKATYDKVHTHWQDIIPEMQHLEEENNRIFIEAYGLQDELTPEVPLSEITLTCNPHYRYNGDKTEEELESLLLTDTIKELISYSIGCMMGRYSLDEPGLIYAYSGNIGFDPSKYKKFPSDDDGIVPIMDLDWFPDDAANRFEEFIKVAWTVEYLDENLKFVADNLNAKKNEGPIDTIRRYLSTTFFKDHLKTYKKRPIYWLFSSGKQKAFECLVYLHRYNETTLSRMRSAYVTPLQGNIRARIEFLTSEKDAATSASDQRKYQKEIEVLKKKQTELSKFDDELRHYADMKISLDLDDGVKVNYGKFGNLLAETKAVTGT